MVIFHSSGWRYPTVRAAISAIVMRGGAVIRARQIPVESLLLTLGKFSDLLVISSFE